MLSVTSCPNCETSFVVTQSQLAAHSGKVRCSNCNHVFNASEWLIEVPADSAEGFGRFGSVAHQPAILSDLASTRDRIQMPEQKKSAPGFYPALIAGLTLMLILQTTIAMRSQLAGKWPETKPFLGLICNVFSCAVTLPQEVDLLAIDDLELREDAERQGLIRLSSTLINSAKFAQAFPMLELSLTGADDKVLIRRIFSPGEYLPAGRKLSSGIAAGEDLHINLAMKVIDVPVAGYRMFILYP